MSHSGLFVGLLLATAAGVADGGAATTARLVVTVTEPGGGRLPCRVHLSVNGKPVYAEGLPRFERDPHFVCTGRFELSLHAGKGHLRIERGPEYCPFATDFDLQAGHTRQLPVELSRWIDMNDRGWFSGDLHVHCPVAYMPLLLAAEDVNVAPVLTHCNQQHFRTSPPYLLEVPERSVASPKPRRFHTLAQEDERAGGAILMLNLRKPVRLEGVVRDHPSGFAYHRLAQEQDGAFIDLEKPFWWEAPVHVALGRVDAIGIACNHFQRQGVMDNEAWGRPRDRAHAPGPLGFAHGVFDLYYRYLNLGYQIAASAGSASGVLASPLGYNRVYVRLGEFGYAAWFDALRAGRSVVTNGPMLFATVNGKPVGTRFEVGRGEAFLADIELEAMDRDPLARAEIVVGGKVAATFKPQPGDAHYLRARHRLRIDRSTWLAVRVFEPTRDGGKNIRFAHTSPFYITIARQRPRDVGSARFFVRWLDQLIAATARKQAAARDPAPFDPMLATYRRARAIYQAIAEGR